jgi:hypothetical protein
MKQKIHKFWVWLFGSPKYRPLSRLDWVYMFIKSRYRLYVYKYTYWKYLEQNLHPCFLIDQEFMFTSNHRQKVKYLNGLYTRREIAHRIVVGEPYEWLLKAKPYFLTGSDMARLPSPIDLY